MGVLIQKHRIQAGLTQEDLAHAAGMTRTHYQQVERGWWKRDQPSNPSLKVLVRIAQQLEVPVGRLLPDGSRLQWQ